MRRFIITMSVRDILYIVSLLMTIVLISICLYNIVTGRLTIESTINWVQNVSVKLWAYIGGYLMVIYDHNKEALAGLLGIGLFAIFIFGIFDSF